MDLSGYVNVHDAAKLINRKESLIRTLCQQGRFQGILKIGKAWLIPKEEVLNYKPAKRGSKSSSRIISNACNNADNLKEDESP